MTAATTMLDEPLQRETDARELTGMVGLWVFLGSAAVLFATLLGSYALLRAQQPGLADAGRDGLPRTLAGCSTLTLALSSVTLLFARRHLRPGTLAGGWMDATLFLGASFLALQIKVGRTLWASHATGSPSLVNSVLMLLLGTHGAHAIAALALLLWAFLAAGHEASQPATGHDLAGIAATFWHFLDAVWMAIYFTVFWT